MDCVRGFGSGVVSRFVDVDGAIVSGSGRVRVRRLAEDQTDEEASDLGQAQGDEVAVAWMKAPFLDRVTVRKAWASIQRVIGRYQPVY